MKKLLLIYLTISLVACEINTPVLLGKGTWGSDEAQLIIIDKSAELQFTCASGKISREIELSDDDTFEVNGTYSRSSGVPPLEENYNRAFVATYSGSLNDGILTLVVNVDSLNIENLTYYLELDYTKEIPICP